MERLSPEQSKMLHLIYAQQTIEYESLSDSDKKICDHLIALEYISPQKIRHSSSTNGVYRNWSTVDLVTINEAGKMYLINEKLDAEQFRFLQEQMQSLRELADTAKADSEKAKRNALFSKTTSIIAIAISLIAIIVPVLT